MQYAPTAKIYISTLIDDVQNIVSEVEREKELYNKKRSKKADKSLDNIREEKRNPSDKRINENDKINLSTQYKNINLERSRTEPNLKTNSLGLTMEGKHGIHMAIIKGASEYIELGDNLMNDKESLRRETDEQILLKKNYQNLEDLINHTMSYNDYDTHYLKIAKLNRLKVLMETSMKIVGRPYNDISNEERNTLELEANRFHTTYPLPGEEVLLEEIRENGERHVRMPLKIIQEDGAAKVDINESYRIDPSEFVTLYTNKLVNHAEESTGLKVNKIFFFVKMI